MTQTTYQKTLHIENRWTGKDDEYRFKLGTANCHAFPSHEQVRHHLGVLAESSPHFIAEIPDLRAALGPAEAVFKALAHFVPAPSEAGWFTLNDLQMKVIGVCKEQGIQTPEPAATEAFFLALAGKDRVWL